MTGYLSSLKLPRRGSARVEGNPVVEAFLDTFPLLRMAGFEAIPNRTRRKNGQKGAATRLATRFARGI